MKKKLKKKDIFLHMCTMNKNHMMYGYWDVERNRFFCHFGPVFALLPPNNPENKNFEKIKKTLGDTIILNVYQKLWSHDVQFLRYGEGWSQKDGLKKWHRKAGAHLMILACKRLLVSRKFISVWNRNHA